MYLFFVLWMQHIHSYLRMCRVYFHMPLSEIRDSLGVVHKMSNIMRSFTDCTPDTSLIHIGIQALKLTFTDWKKKTY